VHRAARMGVRYQQSPARRKRAAARGVAVDATAKIDGKRRAARPPRGNER